LAGHKNIALWQAKPQSPGCDLDRIQQGVAQKIGFAQPPLPDPAQGLV
jgi:hypothetical protein